MDLQNADMKYDKLIKRLQNRRRNGDSYETIALDYPPEITRAHIWHMLRGWNPEAAHLRQALDLPAMKPAPVCHCGQVHTTKRCTANDARKEYRDLWAMPKAELLRRLNERT